MTWRGPEGIEPRLLADTRARWPAVIPLARVLTLAPRIEPLLLRNARLRFLPKAGAEVESQLWFCPLVAARSTREIVLHLGLARVLAGELAGATPWPLDAPPTGPTPDLAEVWRFTQAHTRHWSPEDRLERDLRYHALRDDEADLDRGLRSLLAEIARESDPDGDPARRRDLARLAKRVLPTIRPALGDRAGATARLLARYAALALGDAGDWTRAAGPPDALPHWLEAKLPPARGQARLGVEVRADGLHGQVLHLVAPADHLPAIELPTALPGRLHVAPAGHAGDWHPVRLGTRIPIRPPSPVLRLGTLVGTQWDLICDALPLALPDPDSALPPLLLAHAPADREQAEIIADWLRSLDVDVDLLADQARTDDSERTPAPTPAPGRILRLWTRAAHALWAGAGTEPADETGALLLRTEAVAPPDASGAAGRLLEWTDWRRLADSPLAADLAQAITRWWREGALPLNTGAPVAAGVVDELPTREVERPAPVTLDADADTAPAAEIRRLLAEIADPATEPPRRLVIGDRLAELGDPRPGVGLRPDGLPDIAWVEIPGGPFIYQQGEARTLPTFWISRYPITNAQFQAFIADEGYERSRDIKDRIRRIITGRKKNDWWRDLPHASQPVSIPRPSNHPRTGTSWYEAIAYSRWLTARRNLTHSAIRLPTELEWEKAARGTEGFLFPWGNEYKFGLSSHVEAVRGGDSPTLVPMIERLTARNDRGKAAPPRIYHLAVARRIGSVGLFPNGASPFFVEDMVTNCWEWCLNEWGDTSGTTIDASGRPRALRGGCFDFDYLDARGDARNWERPEAVRRDTGFRLVSSVNPVTQY